MAVALPKSYYQGLAEAYRARRDRLMPVLEEVGFRCFRPRGAYYVMTNVSGFGYANDVEFAEFLVRDVGVAVVPGSSFYRDPRDGAQQVRFAFCKKDETLDAAAERLRRIGTRA
jgi:aminotransferase